MYIALVVCIFHFFSVILHIILTSGISLNCWRCFKNLLIYSSMLKGLKITPKWLQFWKVLEKSLNLLLMVVEFREYTLWFKKNAPTLADYNYDPVQSILIVFSRLFVNDHKSRLVVKFSTSPHICCHYTLWNTMLYFSLITLLIAKNAPTSDHHNFNKC